MLASHLLIVYVFLLVLSGCMGFLKETLLAQKLHKIFFYILIAAPFIGLYALVLFFIFVFYYLPSMYLEKYSHWPLYIFSCAAAIIVLLQILVIIRLIIRKIYFSNVDKSLNYVLLVFIMSLVTIYLLIFGFDYWQKFNKFTLKWN